MHDQEERLAEDFDDLPENHRLAIAFEALSGANSALALLNRYQARLHHEYQRILKALQQMQSARTRADSRHHAKLPNEPNPISEHSAASECSNVEVLPFPSTASSKPGKRVRRHPRFAQATMPPHSVLRAVI